MFDSLFIINNVTLVFRREIYREMKKVFVWFVGLLLLSTSCSEEAEKETKLTPKQNQTENTTKPIEVPNFNSDSAYQYIEDQVNFGPRVPNSLEHVACRDYLEHQLEAFGFEVFRQTFMAQAYDGTLLNSYNIIGSYNPEAKKRILLASHWDSRPFADQDEDEANWRTPVDGANDGASGVGILLELARTLNNTSEKPNVGVDIIFFDSEDYGAPQFYEGETKAEDWCLGSQYWAANKHTPNYTAFFGILLDMVGAPNATFYKEGQSMHYAPSVVQKVWQTAQGAGFGDYFVNAYSSPIIDDHVFVNYIANIPMIDIIHYNHQNPGQYFGEYWHTHDDNMNAIDKNTLKAVGQTLLYVLYGE